ncbi:transposase [Streptomyces cahuitamycinicus]|uniref:transposase n=1 Tax=Streptomyces cahuitamycinicus TaxID=2070367 RepID=UPI0034E0BE18
MAHRVRRRTRLRWAARPGRGPHRRRRAGLARHHTPDLAQERPARRHRYVVHLRAALRTGLPHATVVVDHFHVVQLANRMLSLVRRRTTAEWKARRRLVVQQRVPNGRDCSSVKVASQFVAGPGTVRRGRNTLSREAAGQDPDSPDGRVSPGRF